VAAREVEAARTGRVAEEESVPNAVTRACCMPEIKRHGLFLSDEARGIREGRSEGGEGHTMS
jgi:hypothetical protein